MGDEGPLGVLIALCTRAVPIRVELAAASARLGLERAENGSETAQERLKTAMKRLRNGWTVIFHQPRMIGNDLDHGVELGVGCDGRTLWLAVGSLDERRGRRAAALMVR